MNAIPLENIKIATPCPADWGKMKGDDRVRFCEQCKLHVYNLSGMSRNEAENLVSRSEGRLCVRLFKREDGTVLTKDCPVGLAAALRRRYRLIKAAIVSLVLGIAAVFGYQRWQRSAMEGRYIAGEISLIEIR